MEAGDWSSSSSAWRVLEITTSPPTCFFQSVTHLGTASASTCRDGRILDCIQALKDTTPLLSRSVSSNGIPAALFKTVNSSLSNKQEMVGACLYGMVVERRGDAAASSTRAARYIYSCMTYRHLVWLLSKCWLSGFVLAFVQIQIERELLLTAKYYNTVIFVSDILLISHRSSIFDLQ